MKKFSMLIAGCMVAFLLATSGARAADIKKIGSLNIRVVFDNYQKTVDYDKVLETQYNEYEKSRGDKIETIQEKQGKLSLLKEDDKAKAEQELQQLIADLQAYDREQQTDLAKKRDEHIREIMLEIEQLVGDYAGKEGFDLILNSNVLIWQGNSVTDISEQITEMLNKNYTKKK